MFTVNYLNSRQIGLKIKPGIRFSDLALNVDHLLPRLVCLKKDVFTVFGEENNVPPFACKFRKDSFCDTLAVATEDGIITLYNTRDNASKSILNSFTAHHNAIWDICWLPDKCQLISGSGDLSVCLWDMSNFKLISEFINHTESVKSVDVCHEQSAIFSTGSRDGNINIWDIRDRSCILHGKPSIKIYQAHSRSYSQVFGRRQPPKGSVSSVSAVAFQDSFNLASAGIMDGVVKLWDLRKTYVTNPKFLPIPKYKFDYSAGSKNNGCSSIAFDSLYKTLYACTTGNKILKFNCHSYNNGCMAVYEGFCCTTYFVKLALSCDDQYLLCGSSDNKAYIWKTSKPGLPILQLPGHDAEVTSVTWSPYDVTKLATCGDDDRVAVWKVVNKEGIEKDTIYSEAEFYTNNPKSSSLLGFADQSLIMGSSITKCLQNIQTPQKPAKSFITNFFSPVTTTASSGNLSPRKTFHKNNCVDILENSLCKDTDLCVSSPHPLMPCNHSHLNSSRPAVNTQSCVNRTENLDLPTTSFDKKNSEVEISPETSEMTNNLRQTKRKLSSSLSSHRVKKSSLHIFGRNKTSARKNSKFNSWTGKTIINYFSVISPSQN